MPRPVERGAAYVPALDGIRAIAVLAVMGYHFGIERLGGGLLGVGVFFTLSGFLITELLLNTYDRTGSFQLGTFWIRRARRLLPAMLVVLIVVVLVTVAADRDWIVTRVREATAAATYVSNWFTIANDVSYFERFAGPGPFDHLWSLAIEEQFYLIWPLVLIAMLRLTSHSLQRVATFTLGLAAASFLMLALQAQPGFDNTRAYEGTDTRAGALLIGCALALIYRPSARKEALARRGPVVIDAAAVLSLGVITWLFLTTTQYSMWMYDGGMLLLSTATAVLIAAVVHPLSRVGRLVGLEPLRWLGERSYGLYLWHMPVAVFIAQSPGEGFSVWRALVQTAVTVLFAALSWHFIEDPIRRHGFRAVFVGLSPGRVSRRVKPTHKHGIAVYGAGVIAVCTSVLTACAVINPSPNDTGTTTAAALMDNPSPAPATPSDPATTPPKPHEGRVDAGEPSRTSCTSVVHVGDSTSIGLMDPSTLPDRSDRIDAQYRTAGVDDVATDILGARSIVETYEGQPNAEAATTRRIDGGYDGCWVFAMGTNDTANQYVGGVVPLKERIDRLMSAVRDQPAMWITVKTRLGSGPWQDEQMQKWNEALEDACRSYPNMHVFDWRREVQDQWFASDGIHFTSAGYRARAKRTALALAAAFPDDDQPADTCLVASGRPLS